MSKVRFFFRFWLPICLWMALIFKASGDSGSFNRSSRIIGPLVKLFFPTISAARLHEVIVSVRKTAHVTEYGLLAIALFRAARGRGWVRAPWEGRKAWVAIGVAGLYAITDEFHQAFVPNREAKWADVLIDTTGAALGILMIWLVHRRLTRKREPAMEQGRAATP